MKPRSALRRPRGLPVAPIRASLLALAGLSLAFPLTGAQAREPADFPVSRSLVGAYLSARYAKSQNDLENASRYFSAALIHAPDNEKLIEEAFVMKLSTGDYEAATHHAERLIELRPQSRLARLFLGLAAFKRGDLEQAEKNLKASASGPIGELTASLMRAWLKVSQKKVSAALALIEKPRQAEWAQHYLNYHRALIADVAKRRSAARAAYQSLFKQGSRQLRTSIAYARHAAHGGDPTLALSILHDYDRRSPSAPHPLSVQLADDIEDKKSIRLLINTPAEGMAEVLYGLGEALTVDGGVIYGILYLQLSLYLDPRQPMALAALARAFESIRDYEKSNATYDLIPKNTPLQDSNDIRKAYNLNALGKVDEAKALLDEVAKRSPSDLAPLDALGTILRAHKRYEEAIVYYTRALELIDKPDKRHWSYFYSRGTCYERTKQWAKAEVDLKKAMQLSPDQPLVLNYLGYSWIDQGRNLRQGMKLIKKAVSLKPDDGYIVDSLGWAYYRLGRFEDAVIQLERAVELRPDDPVLNDHLGDALWRVGREREARYQWDQALSLDPEPEDAVKIRKKLADGLDAPEAAKLRRSQTSNADQNRRTKRVESAPKAVR